MSNDDLKKALVVAAAIIVASILDAKLGITSKISSALA